MNRLEAMVSELCPDGVEYVRLGDIATITRGGNFQKKHFVPSGHPCIHYGQIHTYYGVHTDRTISFVSDETFSHSKHAQPGDIVMAVTSENVEGVCKSTAWLGDEPIAVSGHTAIIHHNQNAKFLSYFFGSSLFYEQKKKLAHGVKVIEVTPHKLADIVVPVPPLEVQAEIVRILDKFEAATSELTELLGAELTARRRQYAYYRDKLLTFGDDVPRKSLAEVCVNISSGGTPNTLRKRYYGGNIPWLRTQEVDFCEIGKTELHITEEGLSNSSAKWIPANCVIVAMYGATVGKCAYTSIPLTTNQACCNLEVDSGQANYKYVYYCLCNQYEYIKSLGRGTQTNINMQIVKQLTIPLPPLEEQIRIVDILDRFDALTNSLTEGLPAEITARKKQYAYYRDKLLSFPRKAT